ncbi:MAG TPA: ATP-dependent DNA helicase RecG [Candidatus Polarisedimenticolia bacterium]|jgi:ATP-dependent DNA helicase RecG|nr:ATP-dependent DNA helicase RecG [Candidatus Polarisedimenticolia bacterium]
MSLDLGAPVGALRGIGPVRAKKLAEEGIRTVEDFLLFLPFRYEDRSRFVPVANLVPGDRVAVTGRITGAALLRTRVRGFTLFRIRLADDSGALACVWYNQPYLRNVLKEGREAVLYGEVSPPGKGQTGPRLQNPQFEIVAEDAERIHTGRIVPVYRSLAGLSTRRIRGMLHEALKRLPADPPDPLPPGTISRLLLMPRATALREVHFPPRDAPVESLREGRSAAHRRLALEELFTLQERLIRARRARRSSAGLPLRVTPGTRALLASIPPFKLTSAQSRVLEEILRDLSRASPMSRILLGDVGSGKTVVALLAALVALENGFHAALMAPTEILAQQHHQSATRLLAPTRHRPLLLTAGSSAASRDETRRRLRSEEARLVIGTQALIQEKIEFQNLGLVLVDEQHRFGVQQRALLAEKGVHPHLLLMTATPIPRSLALVLYGDMEVSLLDERPPGRAKVRTIVRAPSDRDKIYAFIRREASQGRRSVIVYPLVENSVRRNVRSVRGDAASLAGGPLSGVAVGGLHGKMSAEEKSRVMAAFASGEISVLVATTVVEVGIDVPEASVMIVENADRFGLSQLHQLRGRVGRGGSASWCILLRGENITPEAEARLAVLCATSDGFEIARRDLELRGPGELQGLRQAGDPGLRVARLGRDQDLLEIARREAEERIESSARERVADRERSAPRAPISARRRSPSPTT